MKGKYLKMRAMAPRHVYTVHGTAKEIANYIEKQGEFCRYLQADGSIIPPNRINVYREDGICTVTADNPQDGIYFLTLNSVQKEHALIFNNRTKFNDVIFDIETGYRQHRMKISGFRTQNWQELCKSQCYEHLVKLWMAVLPKPYSKCT